MVVSKVRPCIKLSEMLGNTKVVMQPMHMMNITSFHFPVTLSGKKYYTIKPLLNHLDTRTHDMIKRVLYTMAIRFRLGLESLQTGKHAHFKQSSTDPLSIWLSQNKQLYNKLLVGEVDTFFKRSVSSHRNKIPIVKVTCN